MFCWLLTTAAAAPDDAEEVVVEGTADLGTATSRTLDAEAVEAMPARSADELLRAVPGLQMSAHGGRGKAFQFLLRGFDAEHGADFAVTAEGVPLNEPSNVHGQGYLDLSFLPVSLVSGLTLRKGSYAAEVGDFALTGDADYALGLVDPGLQAESTVGTDRGGRGFVAWRPRSGSADDFAVAELEGAQGVGDGRRYDQVRAAVGAHQQLTDGTTLRGAAFVYQGHFESPGVLRSDDLDEGLVPFFGAYPEHGDGESSRAVAFGLLRHAGARGSSQVLVWTQARALRLDQNFTGYLRQPERGDGARQTVQSAAVGARSAGSLVVPIARRDQALRGGLDLRGDHLTVGERAVTTAGVPWQARIDARVRQSDVAGWGEVRAQLGPHVSVVPGLRVERLDFAVSDALGDPAWTHSGATVPLPRGTATVQVVRPLTLYASAGRGIRSPDARGTADGDRAPVVTADSVEGGAQLGGDPVRWSTSVFGIDVANELVFDHLQGRFLSAGRTRRVGLETILDVRPTEALHAEVDATLVDGRFVQTDAPIPYAPRVLVTGALFAEALPVGAAGTLTAGARGSWLGKRPLPDGFASTPSFVVNLTSRFETRRWTVGIDVDNLFASRWRDGEFVFPSWFDRAGSRSELPVVHVTAGDPFAARLTIGARW